jgi:hypothetical protein
LALWVRKIPFQSRRNLKGNHRRSEFFSSTTICTETVQSEVSLWQALDFQSQEVLFHMVFNRTFENFYTTLTFLSPSSDEWLSNCLHCEFLFLSGTRGIFALRAALLAAATSFVVRCAVI